MVFSDSFYPVGVATAINSELARAQIVDSKGSFTTASLAPGTHLITATHEPSGVSVTLVQVVHTSLSLVVSVQQIAETAKNRAFFAAPAHQSRHR